MQPVHIWLKRFTRKDNAMEAIQIHSEIKMFSDLAKKYAFTNPEINKLSVECIELLKERLISLQDEEKNQPAGNILSNYERAFK